MKPSISIGANICRLRREARLTQDELASFLGVTKASVSKWETGQSNPDIELLLRIATYFGETIDDLVGYEPQMSREEIRRELGRLRTMFTTQPFNEAHARCQELVRDYYSCYPLLAQIALIYLNHADLVPDDERSPLFEEAVELCRRVRRDSQSSADVKQAEAIEASFLLMKGDPQAVVDMLVPTMPTDTGNEALLANAYGALGRTHDAEVILQGSLFNALIQSLGYLSQMTLLSMGDSARLDAIRNRIHALSDAFSLERTFANMAAVHLSLATAYARGGHAERTLDCLEDYERSCRSLEFPIVFHSDAFFDKLEEWMDASSVAGTDVPRDETLVKKSIVDGVASNPAFASLASEARFRRIVKSLEEVAR